MLKFPTPVAKPDYSKIIEDELSNSKKNRKKIKKRSKYITDGYTENRLVYCEEIVDSFSSSAEEKMNAEYARYCRELNDYEQNLLEFIENAETEIKKLEEENVKLEKDFNIAKEFYDGFQKLVNDKRKKLQEVIRKLSDL